MSRAANMPWSGLKEIYPTQHLNDIGAVNLKGMCVMIGKPFGDRTTVGQWEVVQASNLLL